MKPKIEKNVPLIEQGEYRLEKGRLVRESLYPLAEMEIGDSFQHEEAKRNAVRAAVSTYRKRTGRDFVTRKIAPGLCRTWRTT